MVVKSMYYRHKIPNIELVILCVLHHSRPKRKQCSRTMGGQDPPKAPSSWPPYNPVLSLFLLDLFIILVSMARNFW
jgi:hypothetical protein